MEREELESRINAELGSTQLQISEQTKEGFYDDILADIGDDDSKATPEFITRKVNNLFKKTDGNFHKSVATTVASEIEKYKKAHQIEKPVDKPVDKPTDEKPQYVKDLEKEIEAMKSAQKTKETENAKNAIKESIKNGFEANQKKANLETNSYVLRQTLRDLELPEDLAKTDTEELVKKFEKDYNKSLKEAGFESKSHPNLGKGFGGKGSKSPADSYFERKGKREGWKKS